LRGKHGGAKIEKYQCVDILRFACSFHRVSSA
jgi:hypothetical protein